MLPLEPKQLQHIKTFCSDVGSIYSTCVLERRVDGLIWGNRAQNPDFLLIWSPYQEGFQLVGQPLKRSEWAEFRRWFDTVIVPFLHDREMDCFEYGADTAALNDMFLEIFADRNIESCEQYIYHWKADRDSVKKPEGYDIFRVDHDFMSLERIDKSFFTEELKNAYGDAERYFDDGIAYVAVNDNEVVAWADMLFSMCGYGNISVKTKTAHRRRGLSAFLTQVTVREMREKGLIPIWDCTSNNLASQKTAVKCGFEQVRTEPVFWFELGE